MYYACGGGGMSNFVKLFLYFWREDKADNYATNGTVIWNLPVNRFEQNCTWPTTPMFAIDQFTPRIWKVSCSNTKADNPDRFFMVFLIVCMQIPGYDLKSHHDRFLSHAIQFVLWSTDSSSHKPLARTALVCAITQRVVVISYRSFGTTYWSHDPWRWDR